MAAHRKVRRHGKINHLPEDVQREVNNLLLEPDITYEDIAEHLQKKGHDISKSAVGRYGKDFLNQVRELKMIEDQANTLVTNAEDNGLVLEEAVSKLLTKEMVRLLMEGGVKVTKIPRILSDFARLQMSSIKREAFKAEMKKKAEKAVKDIEKVAGRQLKPETLRHIKEVVYGLAS